MSQPWEVTILDSLNFWICRYIPLKNFPCKIIAFYLKQFQRYGSPELGAFFRDKNDRYDDISFECI